MLQRVHLLLLPVLAAANLGVAKGRPATVEPNTGRGARVIEPFDYRGMVLNDGPLLRQVLEVRDCCLRVPLRELKLSEGWSLSLTEDMQITTNGGADVEHTFTGSSVRWLGRKHDNAGKCEVKIDGKEIATVDQYNPLRDTPFRYEVNELPAGRHTIRLTLLVEKNPASKNRYANITGFDVVQPFAGLAPVPPGTRGGPK